MSCGKPNWFFPLSSYTKLLRDFSSHKLASSLMFHIWTCHLKDGIWWEGPWRRALFTVTFTKQIRMEHGPRAALPPPSIAHRGPAPFPPSCLSVGKQSRVRSRKLGEVEVGCCFSGPPGHDPSPLLEQQSEKEQARRIMGFRRGNPKDGWWAQGAICTNPPSEAAHPR